MGVDYDYRSLGAQPTGCWIPNPALPDLPEEFRLLGQNELGIPDVLSGGGFAVPKHRRLHSEAAELDQQAQIIEDQAAGAGVAAA